MRDPLDDLYRSAAREAPSAAADMAVLGAAAKHMQRRRATPFLALAAVLLVAVLILHPRDTLVPDATPGASPEATRAYLMNLQTPSAADVAGEQNG